MTLCHLLSPFACHVAATDDWFDNNAQVLEFIACVQTSPISFVSAFNKGNRRRLHAGKEFTSSMGIFHRSFLSRISCLLIFLCSGCFIYVYFVSNHELFGSRRGTRYHLR